MKNFLLIFRDHEQQWQRFSPAQMQAVIERFDAWNAEVRRRNAFIGAGKLSGDPGVTVRTEGDSVLVDGPFCEAKEAVSGYYCVRAEDEAAAVEIARQFPMLDYGGSVEIRELVILQHE